MNSNPGNAKAEIDRLTEFFFGLFSNRGGIQPDLERIFDLFVPQGVIAKCTSDEPEISTLQEFIAPRQKLLTSGTLTEFSEAETSERTQIFGNIATRMSTYRKIGVHDGKSFSSHGIKSFQFIKTPRGWRLLSMIWDDEREGFSVEAVEEFL